MRRLPALVACTATALVVIGMASPAHAADSAMDCSTPSGTGPDPEAIAVATTTGSTYTIQNTNGTACLIIPGGAATSRVSWTSSAGGGLNTATSGGNSIVTVSMNSVGTAVLDFVGRNGGGKVWRYTFTITSGGGGGGGSSSSSSASSTPAPVMQQFGKPATGTCDAAAPDSLNWAGVSTGGWGESWAQWANGGNGGAVCTRTLIYSDNLSGWTVA